MEKMNVMTVWCVEKIPNKKPHSNGTIRKEITEEISHYFPH